jgi:hypothetical protein
MKMIGEVGNDWKRLEMVARGLERVGRKMMVQGKTGSPLTTSLQNSSMYSLTEQEF